ncbi:hypothetical protein ACHAL6_07060 [Proteiniclasticum sp. C24MP]|uniref:hypothetical protein n=1 Tax=Proteiniclasticum sp. C24MP TaxID=3374101 RepID=UPI003754058E
MPESSVNEVIERFLSQPMYKRYFTGSPFARKTIHNLFQLLKQNYREEEILEDVMDDAMKETVKSYTSSKGSAIRIFRKFLEFLKDEYGQELQISFPEIDISSSFERQMYLAKMVQFEALNMEDLADKLWVSKRTLEEDLGRIRGKGTDPIRVCGKTFEVKEVERRNGRIHFASTVHPLFLTFNLTQVMATLKGLQAMSMEPAMKTYAMESAASIWQQLSVYAKERIFYVLTEIMPEEIVWYKELDQVVADLFQTEYEMGTKDPSAVLMDCIKNGKPFHVEYLTGEEKSVFYTGCTVIPRSFGEGFFAVDSDQGRQVLYFDRVLKSAYTEEGLI